MSGSFGVSFLDLFLCFQQVENEGIGLPNTRECHYQEENTYLYAALNRPRRSVSKMFLNTMLQQTQQLES